MKSIVLWASCALGAWAAPAWLTHVQWKQGHWTLISQQRIEAQISEPKTAMGLAETFAGPRLELLDSTGTLIWSQALGEPGRVEGHFANETVHAETDSTDWILTLPSRGPRETLRVVERMELPSGAGGSGRADVVQASFALESAP